MDISISDRTLVIYAKKYFRVKHTESNRRGRPQYRCSPSCTGCGRVFHPYSSYEKHYLKSKSAGSEHSSSTLLTEEEAKCHYCTLNWPQTGCQGQELVMKKDMHKAFLER